VLFRSLHYWWLVKADVSRPQTYALIVGVLLGFRLVRKVQQSKVLQRAAV